MAENTLQAPAVSQEVAGLRTSPVAHLAEQMASASVSGERGVSLREIPFLAQVGVRARPGTPSAAALEAALGTTLPRRSGEVTGPAGRQVLWISPDEFLLVADPDSVDVAAAAAALGTGEQALPGSVMDLSANRTTLELSGPSARAVLEKGCHHDLHPSVFAVGTAVSTQLGPVPILLWKTDETTFRLMPRASFADYTVHWLLDALGEFAAPEVP
ncbi:sarcosine oxidase subunit gamma [Arthrobacter sp.]|uniref:sarcosine oxidase subunit gamma n=1 Tax=Arthrobacter sp. TaxID=1667 RepID=UPI003A8EF767